MVENRGRIIQHEKGLRSQKQKIVTKSSCEAEIVAQSDYLSNAIDVRNFLISLGYAVGPVILHQDNKSAMAMMKAGRPIGEKSKHINIRHFFVKYRCDSNEISIQYTPTEQMTADILTKPLQGHAFKKHRNKLLNYQLELTDLSSGGVLQLEPGGDSSSLVESDSV